MDEQITACRDHIKKNVSNPKFIVLAKKNSDKIGKLEKDTFFIQANPVLPTELINALLCIRGRKKSSLDERKKTNSQALKLKAGKWRQSKSLL